MKVIQAAIEANQRQRRLIPDKIKTRFGDNLAGNRFAVWGIAFKANTDDIRESPALALIDALLAADATVTVYDPQATEGAKQMYGDRIGYADEGYAALPGASALIIATEWNEFRHPDFLRIKSL